MAEVAQACGHPMWNADDTPTCTVFAVTPHAHHHGPNPNIEWTYTACWKPITGRHDQWTWRCLRPVGHRGDCGDRDEIQERRDVRRVDRVRDITVDGLHTWCVDRGLDPGEVVVTAAHVVWHSPESDDEAAARVAHAERSAASVKEYEDRVYEKVRRERGDT